MFCAKHQLLALTVLYPSPFSSHPLHAEAQLWGAVRKLIVFGMRQMFLKNIRNPCLHWTGGLCGPQKAPGPFSLSVTDGGSCLGLKDTACRDMAWRFWSGVEAWLFQAQSEADISGGICRAIKLQFTIGAGTFTPSKPSSYLSELQISETMPKMLIREADLSD